MEKGEEEEEEEEEEVKEEEEEEEIHSGTKLCRLKKMKFRNKRKKYIEVSATSEGKKVYNER